MHATLRLMRSSDADAGADKGASTDGGVGAIISHRALNSAGFGVLSTAKLAHVNDDGLRCLNEVAIVSILRSRLRTFIRVIAGNPVGRHVAASTKAE